MLCFISDHPRTHGDYRTFQPTRARESRANGGGPQARSLAAGKMNAMGQEGRDDVIAVFDADGLPR